MRFKIVNTNIFYQNFLDIHRTSPIHISDNCSNFLLIVFPPFSIPPSSYQFTKTPHSYITDFSSPIREQMSKTELPLFIFDSLSNWTWGQVIMFVVLNTIALELLSWVIFIFESTDRKRIPPGGPLIFDRPMIDFFYIWSNKIGTSIFNYHLFYYCYWRAGDRVFWNLNEMTIFNTILAIPLLFIAYDLPYSIFHRFLHWKPVYGYVHKHHHKQRAPQFGNDDAINTHPIEFYLGMYCHLLAIWVVPCHMAAILVFLVLITLFSALNHTRFEVILGNSWLYDNREHDTHHRLLHCNYAAYTQFWDTILGTYRHWSMPDIDYLNWPTPPTPAYAKPSKTRAEYDAAMKANDAPKVALVTGTSGLVGQRLVSMLIQRGAEKVIAVDITPASDELKKSHRDLLKADASKIQYEVGDITDKDNMMKLTKGIDVVFNVAAVVGPYYPHALYDKINNQGVRILVDCCKANKVPKMVMTSSPSTRMDGSDIYNKTEDQMPDPSSFVQLQEYARTKALGEAYALEQNSQEFLVCAIGPHQVYGPTDRLFLPNFIETAQTGRLRILGSGRNLISMCHVDNCCHAHILAAAKMKSPTVAPAGKYYVVTDGGAQFMWAALNHAVTGGGFTSLLEKFNFNTCFLFPIAYLSLWAGNLIGKPFKLNPFVVKMVSMNRYFNIDNLVNDVDYKPIRSFQEAWPETCKAVLERMGLKYNSPGEAGIGPANTGYVGFNALNEDDDEGVVGKKVD
jgi:nucleoside-diphosphate-sugar epimerase/sterol desaturase/sphingolipid hydroxylase (fatty acid hydroxylase superfamily)